MSKKLASLIIKINANGAQAERELKTLEKKVNDFGKSMTNFGKNMSKYVTVPLTALAALSVKAADTQLQAEAKLLNALKGREDMQKRLMAQASEIQSRSLFGDEAIIEQQAFLAALGLSEQQISDTIEAAVQLSAALGMDLTSATKNLAKTFSGMTGELGESIPALKNLTTEELKAGEAIKFVNENYKGFAETAAGTGAGALVQLKNKLGDLAEQIGKILLPVLDDLVALITKLADWLGQLPEGTQKAIVGIGAFAAVIGPTVVGVSSLVTAVKTLTTALPALGAAMSGVAGPLAAIAGVFGLGYMAFDEMADTHNDVKKKRYNNTFTHYKGVYSYDKLTQREVWAAYERAREEYNKAKAAWDKSDKKLGYGDKRWALIDATAKLNAIATIYNERWVNNVMAGETKIEAAVEDTNTVLFEQLGLIGRAEAMLAKARERQASAKDLLELNRANKDIAYWSAEIERLQNFNVNEYTWGDSGIDTSKYALGVGKPKSTSIIPFKKQILAMTDEMVALVDNMNSAISSAFVNVASAIGEGIEAAITGDEFKPMQRLLMIVGDMLKQLGTALVAYATAMEAFKKAFKNPWVALGAGIAAIAAGAVLTGIAKKGIPKLATGGLAYSPTLAVVGDNAGAANDPEVIAPLSKLRRYMGGAKLELVGEVEWELRGDTLRALLNRDNVRIATLG